MSEPLCVLDLFSGIGGFSLGLEEAGFQTVAFCEVHPWRRRLLARRWPSVPIFGDIREVRGTDAGSVDVICGGFPCQDISDAGKRDGIEGARSSLWHEFNRLVGEIRPKYVIVENVAALLGRGMGVVLGSLAALGYDAEWRCVPASVVGLPQTRDRVWIVAYPDRGRLSTDNERLPQGSRYFRWADDDRLGEAQAEAEACAGVAWRADYGLPDWVDRIDALGNAVVPAIAREIGRAILEVEGLAAFCPSTAPAARPEGEPQP